jgi:hypothetical protein
MYPVLGHPLLSAETYVLAAMDPIFHAEPDLLSY